MEPTVEKINDLQNRLHDALTAFASGTILQPSRLAPGTRKNYIHPLWKDKFDRIVHLSAVGNTSSLGEGSVDTYRDAAEILARGYCVLDRWINEQEIPATLQGPLKDYKKSGKNNENCEQGLLYKLKNYWTPDFGNVLMGAYIHGSYSTNDTNAYSDLDTLLILKCSAVMDGGTLYRFGQRAIGSYRYFLQADLLQHHSNFMLTEIDLKYYCEAYFPTVLFKHAMPLFEPGHYEIAYIRDSAVEAGAHLKGMCKCFIDDWEKKHLTIAYYLKMQLSCFMILPAVLLEVMGTPCYKRDSFMLARPLFTPELWSIMDEVSGLRSGWYQSNGSVLKKLAWYQPYLWSQFVMKGGRWAVPGPIWDAVADRRFRMRMSEFASYCLELAEARGKI